MARRRKTLSKAVQLSLIAPQVIALRSLRPHDQREMQRMGTEKVLAFWESMNAMGWQIARANQEYLLFAMRQYGRVLEKGVGPVHKRAAANARRLRR